MPRNADDSQGSPRGDESVSGRTAKKPRGKYTSRACVHCRRRKLKCSGEDPCQRCARHNIRCLFSASMSQRLSEASRLTQDEDTFAAAQPSNPPPEMEARLKSIEATLQALVHALPRSTERGSPEPQNGDEDGGFQGDTTFNAPVDAFSARLATLREQLGCSDTSSPSRNHTTDPGLGSVSTPASSINVESRNRSSIRYGSRRLPFPTSAEYSRYLDLFFNDINACHPCINEADFKSRCQRLVTTRVVDPADTCLLAINYIIFACADILTDVSSVPKAKIPGWNWYLAADELMGKRKISGRGDLGLIQFLVYETFYLIHADKPNAAYNVSGLACRLCFQFGLHQQRLWGANCTPFSRHMRQRLFWTLYFTDRRTALSCGRPYGIRDSDIAVDLPEWIDDKALYPDRPLPEPNPDASFNIFLGGITAFARFAGEIWDEVFSAESHNDERVGEKIAVLDARIKYWLDTVLPTMPLRPQNATPTHRHLWHEALVRTRINHLRLLLRRRIMISLTYNATDGRVCGEIALDIVKVLQGHAAEAQNATSLRFHMAFSLGGAILILATLLCRDLSVIGLQDQRPLYVEAYQSGIFMLRDIASRLQTAVRILEDLKDIVNVVDMLLESSGPGSVQIQDFADVVPSNVPDLFPYGESMDLDPFAGAEDFGASNLTAGDGLGLWDSWDAEAVWSQTGHGVPWV